jgi:methionine sulfoxide reductase catalytic subunit
MRQKNMLIGKPSDLSYSDITPKQLYFNRRQFLTAVPAAILGAREVLVSAQGSPNTPARLPNVTKGTLSTAGEKETPYKDATTYNNFYEFGADKGDPSKNAQHFKTSPWTVSVEGEVGKPRQYSLDDILKLAPLEERIYRHRCVEGWSIVVPWIGFSLSELIKRAQPLGKAKYVQFTSIYDPGQMPGQRRQVLEWPYVEGLRMDEAMHPLTLLCFGMYGETLPNQDGAPLRIVVPWKYGFKSAKAIVKISFVEHEPMTTWNIANPHDFGFYSNVNPDVDRYHSQAHEHRLGEFLPRPTLMFNGYDQVAGLYSGMDLAKNY